MGRAMVAALWPGQCTDTALCCSAGVCTQGTAVLLHSASAIVLQTITFLTVPLLLAPAAGQTATRGTLSCCWPRAAPAGGWSRPLTHSGMALRLPLQQHARREERRQAAQLGQLQQPSSQRTGGAIQQHPMVAPTTLRLM